jgi:hypothetical protein
MNKLIGCVLLFGLLNSVFAQAEAAAPAQPETMVAPAPIPAPAAALSSSSASVSSSSQAAVAVPAAPAPLVPAAATAPVSAPAAPAQAPKVAAPVVAPSAPVAASAVVQSTSFTAEKIKPGKLGATAKSDKSRPAKAENRERWRANRIERAERNHEINRNDGRRLRVQAQRLNKLEVKKEEGANLSAEALQLLDSMLAADLDLTYYAGQDKQWDAISREVKRLNGNPSGEPDKKQKYQQAEERVPSLK